MVIIILISNRARNRDRDRVRERDHVVSVSCRGQAVQRGNKNISVYQRGRRVTASSTLCANSEGGPFFIYGVARQERSEHQVRMRASASRQLPAWDCVERAGLL